MIISTLSCTVFYTFLGLFNGKIVPLPPIKNELGEYLGKVIRNAVRIQSTRTIGRFR